MVRTLGEFLLRGPLQAALPATAFMFLPPLNVLSMIIVALVTLRKGLYEGFFVLVLTLLPVLAANYWTLAQDEALISLSAAFILSIGFSIWVLAAVLRTTVSWFILLAVVEILGLATVLVLISLMDMSAWWTAFFTTMHQYFIEMQSETAALLTEETIAVIATFMTGILVAFILFYSVIMVALARNWQSMLFNPDGFRQEWQSIYLPPQLTIGLFIIFALWLFSDGAVLGANLIPVLLLPFVIVGLSLLHFYLGKKNNTLVWLILTYFMLMLMPQLIFLPLIFALLDTFRDFRSCKIKKVSKQQDED